MREVPIPSHHHPLRRARSAIHLTSILLQHVYIMNVWIAGDDTTALNSVLKPDVWQDHLLAKEARLNARLAKLDATPPGEVDARLEEARDEVSVRLADMEAESGPARAAALVGSRSV
jgi:hypothetical protein